MKNVLENIIEPPLDRNIANHNMEDRVQNIPGWGMDADPDNDPTDPMKHSNGADHERLNYVKAPQQRQNMEIVRSIERPNITRVFGTSTPPAGLSGAIRRYAYKFSEATATHWMTLILADRIDVIEGKINDLKNGILPNPWIERGWRAEWKHNRLAFVGRIAITTAVISAGIMLMSRKNRSSKRK
jgi:hypothetical protein